MAKETSLGPWFMDMVPMMAAILIGVHVVALVYWIYRLTTDRQPQRRKAN